MMWVGSIEGTCKFKFGAELEFSTGKFAMLQSRFLAYVDSVLALVSETPTLSKLLDALSTLRVEVDGLCQGIATGAKDTGATAGQLQSRLNSVAAMIRPLTPWRVFEDIALLKRSLDSSPMEITSPPTRIDRMSAKLLEFRDAYDRFMAHQVAGNAWHIMVLGSTLELDLMEFYSSFRLIRDKLTEHNSLLPGEGEISLVMSEVQSVSTVSVKLGALAAMYEELCRLLNVSIVEFPLRIGKIESGSLSVLARGAKRVIDLLTSLVEEAVRYGYRNYTKEGKIGAIQTTVASVESVLELSNKLKAAGCDTSIIEGYLTKSAFSLAKDLNALTADQPELEINGEAYSSAQELTALAHAQRTLRMKHEAKPRQIGHGDEHKQDSDK